MTKLLGRVRPHYSAGQLREMVGRIDEVMPDRPNWARGKCAWCSADAEYVAVHSSHRWVFPSCGVHDFNNTGGAS